MKKFIVKISLLLFLLLLLCFSGLFLPPTPHASQSLLFGELQKDSLLRYVESPRIIFVGGSNLSFGLNSQIIRDSLHLNPINTAIHAALGVKYMMDNTIQYIQKGDIVVLASEYTAFYREYDEASDELLRIVVDVNRSNIKLLSTKQLLNCLPHIPKFSLSKFNPIKYVVLTDLSFGVYGVHSFNQYGDAYKHWGLNRNKIIPMASLNNAKLNTEVIQGIKKFQSEVSAKGATLLVSFPVMQDISFKKSSEAIKKIEAQYIKNGFTILGTPERYMVPDSLLFDNTGHSTKEGADYRTQLLIEDLKSVLTHIAHYPE